MRISHRTPLLKRAFTTLASLCALLALTGFTRAELADVQGQIEREIKALLADQLAPGEYIAYAIVTEVKTDAAAGGDANVLPYTSLSVSNTVLQEILERNLPKDKLANLKVEVTLGLDERLPEDKRKFLEDVVRKRFGFDGEARVLKVESMKLVSPRLADSERVALEKMKMESEQARLQLEAERSKLEIQKKDLEITTLQSKATQAAVAAAASPTPAAPLSPQMPDTPAQGGVAAANQAPQLGPQLAIFKDFQLTAMALVLGIVLVVAILVGGSFFIKGLSPLSSAIETVGASIETAAKTAGSSQTQVTAIQSEGEGKGGHGEAGAGGVAVAVGPATAESAKANEEFMKQVQDKIEVLSKGRNFNFYRIFSDMIDGRTTLPYAASILVSLESGTARQIVSDLSVEDIAKLRNYLASEGGLIKAKEIKSQAMTDFYGRIAMEEFLSSPLMGLKDLQWLTKMTTPDMAKFIVSLSDTERPIFLACLSPERVKRLLASVKEEDKEVLLRSLALIDTVTEDKIRPVIEQLSKRMSGSADQKAAGPRLAVDSAKYIATIASDLSEAEQTKLFGVLQEKAGLVEGIKEHFIPFATVTSLPKELVLEIFGDKQDNQIAQIIFDSAEDVRKVVLSALPEIRAESVKDELRALDDNKFYDKRNRKLSLRLQKEISRYLQRLYAEGLLTFQKTENQQGEPGGKNESAA